MCSEGPAPTWHSLMGAGWGGEPVLWLRAVTCCPSGLHQGRAPRLLANTYSEEGHARLHPPGVSFPLGMGSWGEGTGSREGVCGWTDPTLNLPLSSLEPELEEQVQSDLIHSCLHSLMAVPPEPEGEGGPQEVSPRAPHPRPCLWVQRRGCGGRCGHWWADAPFPPSSSCTWTPCTPLRIC